MEHSPSNKIDRPFESYFEIAFERLSAFLSLKNPHTNCFRVFHGFNDSFPSIIKGLTIDYYESVLLIQTSQQTEENQNVIEYLQEKLPKSIPIVYKSRYYENGIFLNKTSLLNGSVASKPFFVKENNLLFTVQLTEKLDTGLYLDTALVREWLFKNSSQKKILNLYSYTCSYGVSATIGGAFDVINVDSSRSALQTGKTNYEANHIAMNPRSFSLLPVSDYLRFAQKRKDAYDTIIIDPSPPPLSMHTVEEKMAYYLGPIKKCQKLLKPEGLLLVSCHNFLDVTPDQFKETIQKSTETLQCLETIGYPEGFSSQQPKMFVFKTIHG